MGVSNCIHVACPKDHNVQMSMPVVSYQQVNVAAALSQMLSAAQIRYSSSQRVTHAAKQVSDLFTSQFDQ